ncbi:MAG: signal peptidase II [Gemmatimonadaceae bacterium]
MKSPGRVVWPIASLLVLADCSSKRAIEAAAPMVGVPVPIVDNIVRFTLAYNKGAAFSMHFGPYQRWVLIGLALTILLILARSYRRITQTGRIGTVALGLVAGGAVGNLLDRLISERGVVDFIDVGIRSSRFYVFNLADAGVSIGAALLAYALWKSEQAEGPRTPGWS